MDRIREEQKRSQSRDPDESVADPCPVRGSSSPSDEPVEKVPALEKKEKEVEAMDTSSPCASNSRVSPPPSEPAEPAEDPVIHELDAERHSVVFHLGRARFLF